MHHQAPPKLVLSVTALQELSFYLADIELHHVLKFKLSWDYGIIKFCQGSLKTCNSSEVTVSLNLVNTMFPGIIQFYQSFEILQLWGHQCLKKLFDQLSEVFWPAFLNSWLELAIKYPRQVKKRKGNQQLQNL